MRPAVVRSRHDDATQVCRTPLLHGLALAAHLVDIAHALLDLLEHMKAYPREEVKLKGFILLELKPTDIEVGKEVWQALYWPNL